MAIIMIMELDTGRGAHIYFKLYLLALDLEKILSNPKL